MKTTFLANVSHELRTPLQGIVGYTDLLMTETADEATRSRLNALRRNGDLMVRLVHDLIDLAALETGAFRLIEKPAALGQLVGETIETLRPKAEAKHLRLSFTVEPGVPAWVQTDPERVRQIVLNLVSNAVKFTAVGQVDVTLMAAGRGEETECVELVVRDTGPGIPEQEKAKLFEPFIRLTHTVEHEGSGLGLALSARLARRMGGDITLESDGKNGATFRAHWRARRTVSPAMAAAHPETLRNRHILIADDNALVRELFYHSLSSCGATCSLASDGSEALSAAIDGNCDALILDLAMPRLNGLEIARRLRRAGRKIRIVGVSAHAGSTEREEALRAGMDEFLTKPVDLKSLARALELPSAPSSPETIWNTRREQWEKMFRAAIPEQVAAIEMAKQQCAWSEVKRIAHYLRNSAAIVCDDEVFDACAALEDAASAVDPAGADQAWRHCQQALRRWETEPTH